MGFWNYLGMALVARHFLGKKRNSSSACSCEDNYYDDDNYYNADSFRDREREQMLDKRMQDLSDRIGALESRLGRMDPSSRLYGSMRDDLETLRDEFDDLETDME